MKLTIDQIKELIDFIRRADAHHPGLGGVEIYGSGELDYSADEAGEDPYYSVVGLSYLDDEEEVQSIFFRDGTLSQCHRLLWEIADKVI